MIEKSTSNEYKKLFSELEMNGYIVIPRGSRVGVRIGRQYRDRRQYRDNGNINTVMYDIKDSEKLTLVEDIIVYPGILYPEREVIGSYFLVPPDYLRMREGDTESREELERVRQKLVEGFVDRYSLGCDRGKYICDVSLSILD